MAHLSCLGLRGPNPHSTLINLHSRCAPVTGRSVEAVAVEANAAAATGDASSGGSKKKRRVADTAGAANGACGANGHGVSAVVGGSGGLTVTEPSAELSGHLHCVTAVCWPAEKSLYSGGWDHSVGRV